MLADLLNNHMKSSFANTVPSKFDQVKNDAQIDMGVKENHVREAILCGNGVVYITDSVYEMARQLGTNKYLIARKAAKLYMKDPHAVEVQSITTAKKQTLFIDKDDVECMRGKRVVIVDDVISTGESLFAVDKLVKQAGGIVAGKMAILAEGDAEYREDITYLQHIPLLFPEK